MTLFEETLRRITCSSECDKQMEINKLLIMNCRKLYLLIKDFLNSSKNHLKKNLASIVKGITTSVLTVFVAVLVIPLVNNLISKHIEPYSVSLLDLDKRIFIFIDWSIIMLAILILAIAIYKFRNKKAWHFPTLLFNIFLFGGTIWGYESYVSEEWLQWDIFNTGITYSSLAINLLFTVLIVYFGLWSKFVWTQRKKEEDLSKVKQPNEKDYVYTGVTPIETEDEDILGRKIFARNLANWIVNLEVGKGACSIAINSPWGYGKTSFLNLIKEQLEKNDDFIIMEFSPWHFSPASDITKMFFSMLENEFKGINSRLSDFFEEYGDLLCDTELSFIQKIFKKEKDYKILMSEISNLLKNSRKRLVIIIDDFDRLISTEIQEVLRLIRGSANFPNFIFLTAFDKDYVQATLRESSYAITPQYIEKFFEHEYNLPKYSKKVLSDKIIEIANQFLKDEDQKTFYEYVSQDNSIFNKGYVFEPLGNLRGIYRWMNSISVKYRVLKSECVITDLADLELLNMLYPQIYNELEQDTETYLIAEHGANYTLWDETQTSDERFDWLRKNVHKNLKKTIIYTSIPDSNRADLDDILDRLLPKYSWHTYPKSFRDSNYTYRYFYQDLHINDMSDREFVEFISQPLEDVKEIISNDKDNIYLNRLWLHSKDQKIESHEVIKNLLHVMFFAMAYYGKYFDVEIVFKHLENLKLSEAESKKFLISLINENGYSFGLMSCYSLWNRNRYLWNKYLSNDDMNGILKNMIQYAIQEDLQYDQIKEAHIRTSILVQKETDNGKKEEEEYPLSEIEDIYKTYIAKSLVKILSNLIWENRNFGESTGEYYVSTDFTRYWNNWSDFESFCDINKIDISKNNDTVKEFKGFVEAYIINNRQPLKFKFNCIEIS